MKKYDFAVIGGGSAGYKAALKLAGLKKNVCLIEKTGDALGGVCLNEGCIPMKSLLESARLFKMTDSDQMGIQFNRCPPDFKKIMSYAGENISALRAQIRFLLARGGVELIFGQGSFVSDGIVEVEGGAGELKTVAADKIIIASGSVPGQIPGFVPGGAVLDTSGAFRMDELPSDILIVGGGITGCEFASAFSMLGVRVALAEMKPVLLPGEDSDTSRFIQKELSRQGVEVLVGIRPELKENNGKNAFVRLGAEENSPVRKFEKIIIAAGRRPEVSRLSLEKTGVTVEKGAIRVSEIMKTGAGNIFAAGDVTGINMTAHAAYLQGEAAAAGAAGTTPKKIDYSLIPRVIFTSPQVAGIGITEEKARLAGYDYETKKVFFKANAKAVVMREPAGYLKVISGKKSGKVLGAAVAGPGATELIHLFAPACAGMVSLKDLAGLTYAHPTLSEIVSSVK